MEFANPKYLKRGEWSLFNNVGTETEVVEGSIGLWWEEKDFAFPGERVSAAEEHLMDSQEKSTTLRHFPMLSTLSWVEQPVPHC